MQNIENENLNTCSFDAKIVLFFWPVKIQTISDIFFYTICVQIYRMHAEFDFMLSFFTYLLLLSKNCFEMSKTSTEKRQMSFRKSIKIIIS